MKTKIITSFCLYLIICSFFTFILSQTGIKEWPIMAFITFIVGALIVLGVMYCVDKDE